MIWQAISHIEARQAGWVNSAAKKQQPWDGDFETPLHFSGVWSLAGTHSGLFGPACLMS